MNFNTNPITYAEEKQIAEQFGADTKIPDWAESLTRIRLALRQLDDAFPRSDAKECLDALAELKVGVDGIAQFLAFRGVM